MTFPNLLLSCSEQGLWSCRPLHHSQILENFFSEFAKPIFVWRTIIKYLILCICIYFLNIFILYINGMFIRSANIWVLISRGGSEAANNKFLFDHLFGQFVNISILISATLSSQGCPTDIVGNSATWLGRCLFYSFWRPLEPRIFEVDSLVHFN